MFRNRDNDPTGSDSNAGEEIELRVGAGDEPLIELRPETDDEPMIEVRSEPKPVPLGRREPNVALTPPKNPSSDTDLPESKPLSAAPKSATANSSTAASSNGQPKKRLIVGQGIRLSGEINSCDRLVVEGEVEVTLNDTLALEITSSGRFTGGCEVEEADISGVYEGDLTVRNTLFVRGTGRITGTIRYGQLELERGGQIAGNISVLGNENGSIGQSSAADLSKARSAKAPLFGGSNG